MKIPYLSFLVWLLFVPFSRAAEDPKAFDERILRELEAVSPEAAKTFESANQARDSGEFEKASRLYAEVRSIAPGFVHAIRRQCGVEEELGHHARALELCREALAMEESVENLSALASVLMRGSEVSWDDRNQALQLAVKATAKNPDDLYAQMSLCQASLETRDMMHLDRCAAKLEQIAPEDRGTPVFALFADLQHGNFTDARHHLERARALGLPDDVYQKLSGMINDARFGNYDARESAEAGSNFLDTAWNVGWRGFVVWIGVMLALVILGILLSALVLRSAHRIPRQATGEARGLDALLRKLYRLVLWLSCSYYYLSIPLILVLVVGGGGALLYGIFSLGRIPIKLVAIVGAIVLVTLWAVLKSLFVRSVDEDPGEKLPLPENPLFQSALREVAGRIGTQPVDNVYMTPGTEVAVMERGGLLKQLTGRKERCLILGVGALDGLSIGEFKAIMAHEYGHFNNQDTAGGGFALAVRRSLLLFADGLARGGAAAWYNPAWLFVITFYRVFLRISQGASRLQEVLADRWAAAAYGSDAFERGLTHVLRQAVRFDLHAERCIQEVVEERKPLSNLYTYRPLVEPRVDIVEGELESIINRKPSPYDSHPSPKDRIEWVRALKAKGTGLKPGDGAPAWGLFSNPDQIQREMTNQVRVSLALQGVAIQG